MYEKRGGNFKLVLFVLANFRPRKILAYENACITNFPCKIYGATENDATASMSLNIYT